MLPSVTCVIVVLFFCSAVVWDSVVWDNELWTGECFDEFGLSEGERLGYAAWFEIGNTAELCGSVSFCLKWRWRCCSICI